MLTYKDWLRFIVKRLLLMIPILIGISIIVFTIMEFTPGDPVLRKVGAEATQEMYEMEKVKMGLDKSFPERYFIHLSNKEVNHEGSSSWIRKWRTCRSV